MAVLAALASTVPAAAAQPAPRAVADAASGAASAPAAVNVPLRPSLELQPLPEGARSRPLPIVLRAREVRGQPDRLTTAEGEVELRRGNVLLQADRLTYDAPLDLARATGSVRVQREGAVYTGPEAELKVQRFEGFFREPTFEFPRLGSGGRASRVDFLDPSRAQALDATYTSCPRDGSVEPAWVLETRSVRMDFERNEGIAEGAVLRFLGVPILAAPVLSFPLNDERKSGWLPPNINLDSRSGLDLAVPYYWNLAPNRDATITPRLMSRRGLGLAAEFRYLEPRFAGQIDVDLLPDDRVANRSRGALGLRHDGLLPGDWRLEVAADRVSDDDWWRDFPDAARSLTPRLLPQRVALERSFAHGSLQGTVYARAQHWQVLQSLTDRIASPYQRSPQVGVNATGRLDGGLRWQIEAEANRFTLARPDALDLRRPEGSRVHLLATVARPWRAPWGWLEPRATLNAARYRTDAPMTDGRTAAGRVVPSLAVDGGLFFERSTTLFGRAVRQTLEPKVHGVLAPFRDQSSLPNFDATERDFNASALFADNAFTGIDRVADARQVTGGLTTRVLDATTGVEALRLGVVQRLRLRDQRVTGDGVPLTERFSDVYLLGGTSLVPHWAFDTALQYSTEIQRTRRAVVSARYSPGEFRTLSATYRLTRGASEQLELGWQWPLWGATPAERLRVRSDASPQVALQAGGCGGTWYSVGRVNYSMRDRRITDSVVGLEFDAGCWIGRVVAERLSTGRSEATTRLMVQLELVGLSRIGSNPLKVLRDNIPGYRLLRDDVRAPSERSPYD